MGRAEVEIAQVVLNLKPTGLSKGGLVLRCVVELDDILCYIKVACAFLLFPDFLISKSSLAFGIAIVTEGSCSSMNFQKRP